MTGVVFVTTAHPRYATAGHRYTPGDISAGGRPAGRRRPGTRPCRATISERHPDERAVAARARPRRAAPARGRGSSTSDSPSASRSTARAGRAAAPPAPRPGTRGRSAASRRTRRRRRARSTWTADAVDARAAPRGRSGRRTGPACSPRPSTRRPSGITAMRVRLHRRRGDAAGSRTARAPTTSAPASTSSSHACVERRARRSCRTPGHRSGAPSAERGLGVGDRRAALDVGARSTSAASAACGGRRARPPPRRARPRTAAGRGRWASRWNPLELAARRLDVARGRLRRAGPGRRRCRPPSDARHPRGPRRDPAPRSARHEGRWTGRRPRDAAPGTSMFATYRPRPREEPRVFRTERRRAEHRRRHDRHDAHARTPSGGGTRTMRRSARTAARARRRSPSLARVRAGARPPARSRRAARAGARTRRDGDSGGLDSPTGFTFAPDGRIWYIEKNDGPRLHPQPGHRRTAPVHRHHGRRAGSANAARSGSRCTPAWPAQPFVYVYVTRIDGGVLHERGPAVPERGRPRGGHEARSSAGA